MRMPWSRRQEAPAPPPPPLVRGCKLLRAHPGHEFVINGRVFACPGIEERLRSG